MQHRPLRQRDPGRLNLKWDNIKPQVDEISSPAASASSCCRKAPREPRQRHGHPSFNHVGVVHNQTLAQMELWSNAGKYEKKVYTLLSTSTRRSPAST